VYEDLGDDTLAARPTPERVRATVDLLAELHLRSARHTVLPDVRRYSSGLGLAYFTANVADATAALEAVVAAGVATPAQYAGVTARLLERLYALAADAPRRARVFDDAAGPDTLLHGDVWTINAFVFDTADGARARLIDWDKVGIGPFSYDLSTFLFRFPPAERPGIVDRYREVLARAGRVLPPALELHLLFDTAERARYANCIIWPALALLQEHADWGFPGLAEVERWFLALDRRPA
jgi:aminoglycoside phosphotransferase (APT) family kinase protein